MKTTVKDDAGKHAVWKEKFILNNLAERIKANESLKLDAMEKDVMSSDFLGNIEPIKF